MAAIANAGVDVRLTFASIGGVQALNGTASLPDAGNGGSAVVSYVWSIVDAPIGSLAFLVGSGATPILSNLNVSGTWRIMLEVIDDAGNSSSPDFPGVAVPENQDQGLAFVDIIVETSSGLVKPARSSREWHDKVNEWVDAIDQNATAITPHSIASHTDTTATGSELDELTDGSSTLLHAHPGSQIDSATSVSAGVVRLSDPAVNALDPVALSRDLHVFSGSKEGTYLATGYAPGVITVTSSGFEGAARWRVVSGGDVEGVSCGLHRSGALGVGTTVTWYDMTLAQVTANDFAGASVIDSITLTSVITNSSVAGAKSITYPIAAGNYIVPKVTASALLIADSPSGLTVGATVRKKW